MASPDSRLRRLSGLAGAALLVLGCATARSPSPSPADALEVYRTIAGQIVEIRGLDAPDRADPQVIDPDELRENFEAAFDEANPPEVVDLAERIYRALGLLDPDASLRDAYLEMNSSQVIGYYDSEADELYIIRRSDALGPTERLTYAHEFVHELQDEAFDLESLGLEELVDDGDRGLAILSLVEGDATSAQTTWMTEQLSPAELAQVAAEAADPAMLEILARTPPILLETALFPYQAGATFVTALLGVVGGYDAVNAAYDDLPESTEQILHPERYLAGERPVDVELPDDLADRFGDGWTVEAEDTLGELQLRVWLREGGLPGDAAREAADGWGGDRLALVRGPDGQDVIVLVTAWDDRAAASEFREAAEGAADGLGLEARITGTAEQVVIVIGPGAPRFTLDLED